MLKLKYVMPMLLNLETYYLWHHFQVCLRIGITSPIMGGHVIEKQFLVMCPLLRI